MGSADVQPREPDGRDGKLATSGPMDARALREAAIAGVRWVAAGRVAAEMFAIGSVIVLARLITPAEFGQAAVALILVALASALTGQSVGTPLVQRETIERGHVRSALSLSLGLGFALMLATYLAAPLFIAVFSERIVELIRLMSPVFLVAAVGIVPHALLQRSLDFRRIATIEVLSIVVRVSLSVGLALAGLGAEALVLGALAGSAAFASLLFASAPRLRPGWEALHAREILSFGVPAALSGVVSQTNRNLDYAILGAQLAPAQVGYYWRAYQLGMEYERKVTTVITRMALPIFSRSKSRKDMRQIRVRMMRMNATVVFGALAAFIAVAPVLVPGVFGPAWEPSVVPAQILAVAGMAAAANAGAGPLVLAAGHARAALAMSVSFFFLYGTTILLAAPHGLVVVCIAATAAHLVRTAALHWLVLDRLVGIPLRDLRDDLTPAVSASAVLVLVAVPLVRLLGGLGAPTAVLVVGAVSVGGAAYLAVLRRFFAPAWRDLADVTRRVLGLGARSRNRGMQPVAADSRT